MEIALKDGSATFAQLFYVRAAERLPIRTVTKVRGVVGSE
jgi:hypothetical protein